LKYCLSLAILLSLWACEQPTPLYKRTFTPAEKAEIGENLIHGISTYYQGTAPRQFLLRESQMLYPDNADVYREFGAPLVKRGFAAKLHEVYAKAVELDPVAWQGWRGYLYLYFYRDYERAIYDFNTIDSLTPNFVDYPQSQSVHFMRGICYLQLDQYEQALAFFDKHIEHETAEIGFKYIDTRTFLFKAITYWKQGKLRLAKETLELGLSANAKNADLLYWLAKYYRETGNKRLAANYIAQAKNQYKAGYHHHRPYVEEFYETYWSDLEEWGKE